MQTSPYVTVGDSAVQRPEGGVPLVPVFRANDPAVLLVPPHIAQALELGDDSGLTLAEVSQLEGSGLVGDPLAARKSWYGRMGGRPDGSHKEYVLLPTSYCNMGCEYCGQSHVKHSLTANHREAVRDRVVRGIRGPGLQTCHVAWFGGEPLMGFATIKWLAPQFVAAATAAGVTYTSKMTTNGALLDERKLRVLVDDCAVGRFDITIDGPQDVHDVHRPMKNGLPTWERLVHFLADQVHSRANEHVNFVLRTNVDRANASRIEEYLETMAALGFGQASNVTFQLSPIHSWGNDISTLELSRSDAVARELGWLSKMLELGLHTDLLPQSVTVTCTATDTDHEVIDSRGDVYTCNEHPLVPGHEGVDVVGTVESLRESMRRPEGQFDTWYTEVADGKWPCSECSMLPVCGGCCPKLWHEDKPPCPTFKDNLPQRLTLFARQQGFESRGSEPVG
jgi:uncharacterized protein